MKNNYLEIKNVDFIIGGKTKVKDVSFSIENEGETLCILGPSGIGKTTILRTIAGLEKVNKGSIKLNGKLLFTGKQENARWTIIWHYAIPRFLYPILSAPHFSGSAVVSVCFP